MIQKQSESENLRVVPLNSAPAYQAGLEKKMLNTRAQTSAGPVPLERRAQRPNEGYTPQHGKPNSVSNAKQFGSGNEDLGATQQANTSPAVDQAE